MLTAKKLESAGIALEYIRAGDVVITTTVHGSQMVCGLCGATSGQFADSSQAMAAGESHQCPEPATEWDHCISCGGICPVGDCTSTERYDGPLTQPGTTKRHA